MSFKDVPKWVFTASFALLVLLFAISLYRGEQFSLQGGLWGFVPGPSQRFAAGKDWLQLGETLMCWGRDNKLLAQSDEFTFVFPRKFDSEPTVVASAAARSDGFMYVIYNQKVTETQVGANILEVQDRKPVMRVPVSVSYVAFGKAPP